MILKTEIMMDHRRIRAVQDEENFVNDLIDMLQVASLKMENLRFKLTPEELCKTWGSGITIAKRTPEATTQIAVRIVVHPSVEGRWPTGDRLLQYKGLHHQVFHDNMKAELKSLRGNLCYRLWLVRNFPTRKGIGCL
jgi:hypothetical protein